MNDHGIPFDYGGLGVWGSNGWLWFIIEVSLGSKIVFVYCWLDER